MSKPKNIRSRAEKINPDLDLQIRRDSRSPPRGTEPHRRDRSLLTFIAVNPRRNQQSQKRPMNESVHPGADKCEHVQTMDLRDISDSKCHVQTELPILNAVDELDNQERSG